MTKPACFFFFLQKKHISDPTQTQAFTKGFKGQKIQRDNAPIPPIPVSRLIPNQSKMLTFRNTKERGATRNATDGYE